MNYHNGMCVIGGGIYGVGSCMTAFQWKPETYDHRFVTGTNDGGKIPSMVVEDLLAPPVISNVTIFKTLLGVG